MNICMILFLFLVYGSSACMERKNLEQAKNVTDPVLCIIHEFGDTAHTRALLPELFEHKKYMPNNPFNHQENDLSLLHYDLGQNGCLDATKKNIQQLCKLLDEKFILFACDEGTLTALNYATQKPNCIKVLILDSPFASGNSAISRTAKTLTVLPLSYYWLPYLAKLGMPFYSPAGKQPILNLQNIPKDLPIILVDNPNNKSFNDTKALYAGLRFHGNENTYLFSIKKDPNLYNLTENNQKEVLAIRKILQKHKLLPDNAQNVMQDNDLSKYQPEHDITAYDSLVSKENFFSYLNTALTVAGVGILLGLFIQSV